VFAVMDAFAPPSRRPNTAAAFLGMFTYLSSGAPPYSPADLRGWFSAAGFGPYRRIPVRRLPGQSLYVAIRRDGE